MVILFHEVLVGTEKSTQILKGTALSVLISVCGDIQGTQGQGNYC